MGKTNLSPAIIFGIVVIIFVGSLTLIVLTEQNAADYNDQFEVGEFIPGDYDYNLPDPEYAVMFFMIDSTELFIDSVYSYGLGQYKVHLMNDPKHRLTIIGYADLLMIYYVNRVGQ